jgi:hypothetical protein
VTTRFACNPIRARDTFPVHTSSSTLILPSEPLDGILRESSSSPLASLSSPNLTLRVRNNVCRHDTGHIQTLASKLQDLNDRVSAVRREQQYQREIEATFRDASERVNGRAVWWSVWQIVVLIGVAVAEMRYLKVSLSTYGYL